MKAKVSKWWLVAVLLIALVGFAFQACVPSEYNPGGTGADPALIRQQVAVLSFDEATCYVYVGYGISCVDAKR